MILPAIAPDGLAVDHQPRLPEADIIVVESAEPSAPESPQPRPCYNPFGILSPPQPASPAPYPPTTLIQQPLSRANQ
ncbi:MAG: hypothetical protein RIE73_15295 [Coleofasciculus sp. C1-SOL-03]|uniref:hypothetical protein n=1 Tax=Coleofasciculus sp. C1-SOL-03 TaxID=3069522 RepID=UPI0033048C6C